MLAQLIAMVFFALAVLAFRRWQRPRNEPQKVILSSPRVKNLPDTLTALSALGIGISERARLSTEVDLIRTVELRLRSRTQDFDAGFQELVKASGGLLTKADQVTLQVALLDFELSADDMLPLLNAQLDSSKGQFFYASDEDNEVVFLTPNQVQALTARGWQFQDPPTTCGAPPNPPIERTESAASRPTRSSFDKLLVGLGDFLKAMTFAAQDSSAKGETEISFQPSLLRHLLYSRSRLEESALLSAAEDKVQGVIAEVGLHGSVVVVAGFIDGTPRLIFGRGGGVIGLKESFPEVAVTEARTLVQVGQSCLSLFSRKISRSWPRQGNVRFALLTLGGTYAAEADIENLENGSSPLSPLWETAARLCMELSKLLPERSNAAAGGGQAELK